MINKLKLISIENYFILTSPLENKLFSHTFEIDLKMFATNESNCAIQCFETILHNLKKLL